MLALAAAPSVIDFALGQLGFPALANWPRFWFAAAPGVILGLLLAAPFSVFLGGVVPLDDGQSVGGQFAVQLTGALATAVWCGIATFVLLKLIGVVTDLRVEVDNERQGLDLAEHEERGYNL